MVYSFKALNISLMICGIMLYNIVFYKQLNIDINLIYTLYDVALLVLPIVHSIMHYILNDGQCGPKSLYLCCRQYIP